MRMSANKYLLMIAIGLILIVGPTVLSLQSVEYIQIQTSSPVAEGDVCTIDVAVKAAVGTTGTANLFIDEVFLQSIGGIAGSDGIMYFSTGWRAVGVGEHTLRIAYFETDYPTQPFEASAVITVLGPDDAVPDDDSSTVFASLNVLQIIGFGIAGFGTFKYVVERKKNRR